MKIKDFLMKFKSLSKKLLILADQKLNIRKQSTYYRILLEVSSLLLMIATILVYARSNGLAFLPIAIAASYLSIVALRPYYFINSIILLVLGSLMKMGLNKGLTLKQIVGMPIVIFILSTIIIAFIYSTQNKYEGTKVKKFVLLVMGILIILLAFEMDKYNGNPIVKFIAKKSVENYVTLNYPDRKYIVSDMTYSYDDGKIYQGYLKTPQESKYLKVYFKYVFPGIAQVIADDYSEEEILNKEKKFLEDIKKKISEIYPDIEVALKNQDKINVIEVLNDLDKIPYNTVSVLIELRVRSENFSPFEIATILKRTNQILRRTHNDKVFQYFDFVYYNDISENRFTNITRLQVESPKLEDAISNAIKRIGQSNSKSDIKYIRLLK